MLHSSKEMERLTAGLPTKSAKIRALGQAGFSRTDIAKFLSIRYQHVRNVLLQAGIGREDRGAADVQEDKVAIEPAPARVRVGPDGRIVIPAPMREALGVKEGDVLFASKEGEEIRLATLDTVMERTKAILRDFVPEGVSLADELIAERRREAEQD